MRVCAQTTFIADLRNFIKCDHLLTPIRKGRRISKEIGGIRLNLQGNTQEY